MCGAVADVRYGPKADNAEPSRPADLAVALSAHAWSHPMVRVFATRLNGLPINLEKANDAALTLPISPQVAFEANVFLLTKSKAQQLKSHPDTPRLETPSEPVSTPEPRPHPPGPAVGPGLQPGLQGSKSTTLRLIGDVPPEIWNRLGTKGLPKLRTGDGLRVGIDFSVTVEAAMAQALQKDIQQILTELGLAERVRVEF